MQTRSSGSKTMVRSSWRVLASVGLLAGIVPLACASPTESDSHGGGTAAGADDSADGKSYINVYDGVADTMSDTDMDRDGVPNDRDLCPASDSISDANGCAAGQSPDAYQAPANAPSFDIPGVDVLGNGFVNLKLFTKGGELIEFRTLLENIEILGSELLVKGTLLVKMGDGSYLCLPKADVKFDIDVHGLIDVHGEVSVKIPHLGLLGLICVDADVRAKLDLVIDESECEYPTLIDSIHALLRLQVEADIEAAVGPICIEIEKKVDATLLVDVDLSNFWFKGPLASPMLTGGDDTWMGFSNHEIPTCEEDKALLGLDGAEIAIDGELDLGKLGLDIEGHVYVEVKDDECHGDKDGGMHARPDGCYVGCDGIEYCDAGGPPPGECEHKDGCGACGDKECCGSIEINACVDVELEAELFGHEVELEILEAKVEAEIGCDKAKAKIEGHLLHEKGLWPEILPLGLGVDAKIKAELFDHKLIKVDIWGKIHFEASELDCLHPLKDLTILDAEVTLLEHETIVKGFIDVPLLDALGIKHLTPIIIKLPNDGHGFIIDILQPDSFMGLPVLGGDFVRIDELGPHLLKGLL